jgi:hypothetical protein
VEKIVAASFVHSRNDFAPLRGKEMEAGNRSEADVPTQQQIPAVNRTLRTPIIILTASLNLLKFQAEVKAIFKVALSSVAPGMASE